MNNFHDDVLLNQILAPFGNEGGDDSTKSSLSLAQKVKRKLIGMV